MRSTNDESDGRSVTTRNLPGVIGSFRKDAVDYTAFVKPLKLSAGYAAPSVLGHEGLTARAISRADLTADVAGINASIDIIRRTRGGDWPSGPVTEEFNYIDLVWHELEFGENYSFAYAVYDAGDRYIGCCYFYPMGRRTALDEQLLQHDVDVSWWVTREAYDAGQYARLYAGLRHWSGEAFPFTNPHFSNREIP
jgi:hypothetical protein